MEVNTTIDSYIKEKLEYAEEMVDHSIRNDEHSSVIEYWKGYRDALKRVMEKIK